MHNSKLIASDNIFFIFNKIYLLQRKRHFCNVIFKASWVVFRKVFFYLRMTFIGYVLYFNAYLCAIYRVGSGTTERIMIKLVQRSDYLYFKSAKKVCRWLSGYDV